MPPVPPRVGVAFEAIRRRGGASWLVSWRISNRGQAPVTVVEAWHPHARFHSSRLRRSLRVPPRGSASLELPAGVDTPAGGSVENCFVILRATRGRERWRILARCTLRVDDTGTPAVKVKQVDVHPG